MNAARKLGEKKIVLKAGDFNGCVGSNRKDYEDQHGGYSYGNRNREGQRILEICVAINMTVRKILFKKRLSHQVNYESG